MGTDRDAFYLDGWGYDRLQASEIAKPDYAAFWARCKANAASETVESLKEEIASQAEVIEAQDDQIAHLQEERDALLAELDEKDRLIARAQRLVDNLVNAEIKRLNGGTLPTI
jgi:predicted neuraminidase